MNDAPNELSFIDLQAALDRCMKEHPPTGEERRLHPDANRMADLFAVMALERIASVPRDTVKASVLEAYERWRLGAPAA